MDLMRIIVDDATLMSLAKEIGILTRRDIIDIFICYLIIYMYLIILFCMPYNCGFKRDNQTDRKKDIHKQHFVSLPYENQAER